MRTADQIKRKLYELSSQKRSMEARLAEEDPGRSAEAQARLDRIDDQIVLLDWVLNEPAGSYHA